MDGSLPVRREAEILPPPAVRNGRKRRLLLGAAILAVLAGGTWYGQHWWFVGRFLESTDDAYTQADAVTVAPRVAGTISAVAVVDNQLVHAGDTLARIDTQDFAASLAQAKADIATAEADRATASSQLVLQQATIAQAEADLASARAGLEFSQADYRRYTDLARTGNGTVQRAQQADSDIKQKQAAVARGEASLALARLQIAVLNASVARADAALLKAKAAEDQAGYNLSYATITAPVDGAVGDRQVRLGQYVSPGTHLLDVVPVGRQIYVVANFKETQLAHMWRGERVTVVSDMLPGVTLHGVVDSLAPGSGAQFALLPPENATGNFTKIVQRVPVKIVLDDENAETLRQLRPGLSVTATVDTRTKPEGPGETLARVP
jgi:membrane fusion protein (multidrug efflux system)